MEQNVDSLLGEGCSHPPLHLHLSWPLYPFAAGPWPDYIRCVIQAVGAKSDSMSVCPCRSVKPGKNVYICVCVLLLYIV